MHFKLIIIKSIISQSQPSASSCNLPLVGRHFLQLIPPAAAKSNPQKKCRMCCQKGVWKKICYQRRNCFDHYGLCPVPCFDEYHREQKHDTENIEQKQPSRGVLMKRCSYKYAANLQENTHAEV